MVLDRVNQPQDLKQLSLPKLTELAADIRQALMRRLTKHQGHFGSNFGMVSRNRPSLRFLLTHR